MGYGLDSVYQYYEDLSMSSNFYLVLADQVKVLKVQKKFQITQTI